MKKLLLRITLLITLLFVIGATGSKLMAQTESFSPVLVSNAEATEAQEGAIIPLADLLTTLEQTFETTFLFKDEVVRRKQVDTDKIHIGENTGRELAGILDQLGLTYYQVDEQTYVLLPKTTLLTKRAAQEKISGTVTDAETGEALPGVNILVKGTSTGASTDADGQYDLEVESLQDTLVVTFIGYQTQDIPIQGRTEINIELASEAIMGEEMVVVGYGEQKEKDLTSSISKVEGEKVAEQPVSNITHSLAGNISGVSMRPDGAQPGQDSPDINIRGISTTGNNSPLVVVDGIERDNISEIDQSSVKSVTILKDAAAVAPYGVGGANGVILITTKDGTLGTPSLSLNAYYGIQTPTYYPEMLTAQDYMRLKREAYYNENPNGTNPPYDKNHIDNYANLNAKDPDKYPITNDAGRKIADLHTPMQKYNMQLSGGSEKINYYIQGGFYNQQGMFDQVNYRRYNYTLKTNVQATKTTEVTASLIGSLDRTNDIDPGISTPRLFRGILKQRPTKNMYYSNGKWGEDKGNSPVGVLNSGSYSHNNQNTLLSKITINQELPFIKGLSAKGVFSYDNKQGNIKGWHRPFYYWSLDTSTEPYTYTKKISNAEGSQPTYSYLSQQHNQNEHFTFQGYIDYHNTFGKHDITGLVVAEGRYNTLSNFSARRDHFAVDIDELDLGSSDKDDFHTGGFSSTGSQVGLVFRLGYNYADKYLVDVSGRYDGHYYFAPSHRWGFFPAVSIGWVLSEEDFFKDKLNFLNYLKIRGSWGKSGNLAGSAFQYLSGYNLYGQAYAFGTGNLVSGSNISQEANPNITWEIATKTNVGLNATLWDGLLDIEFDYFHERRSDMLLPPAVTVPIEYGLSLSEENAGVMKTRGVEVAISTDLHNFDNGLQIGLGGNFSYAKNEVTEIFETSATFNNPRRRRTGRAYNTPFGYRALGLFTTADDKNGDGIIDSDDGYNVEQFGDLHPGDIKYKDFDGDGKITSEDKTFIGFPNNPAITFGFTPTANWKNFDLSLFFQGSAMSSLDIRGLRTVAFRNDDSNTTYEYYNNRWTPDHQDAKYPRATQAPYNNNMKDSDFWMVNTSFVRLKTATFGYTIPPHVTQAVNIQSLRIYVTGQNLVTLSNIKFQDPEVGYSQGEVAYPPQKVYTLGLNIKF